MINVEATAGSAISEARGNLVAASGFICQRLHSFLDSHDTHSSEFKARVGTGLVCCGSVFAGALSSSRWFIDSPIAEK